jgi:cobalt-zinc-cadmium efflux system membrane fusion protein
MTPESEHPRRRGILIGGVILAVVFIVVVGRWRSSSGTAEPTSTKREATESATPNVITIDERTRDTIGLKVQAVEQRPFADVIQATGVVTPNETRVAHVRLLAPGRVEQVHVRVGDRVQSGQPLLTYDNVDVGELVGNYLSAAAAVERAAADADVANRALERATKLVDVGGLSRGEYERREAEHNRALAEVTTARAAMTNIERRLQRFGLSSDDLTRLRASSGDATSWSRTIVRAPFAGVVTAANVAPGEAVDTERELFTVADLSTVWVVGDLYQRDIASVRRGQEAQITTESYPGETFSGRITNVSDVLDPTTRTAKVRCEVPNRDGRLKLQMFVTMGIPTATARDTLVVPVAAVQQIDDDTVVFVQTGDESFEKRVVEAGAGSGGWVPVLSGLKVGERVVTDGGFMLKSKLKAASIGEGEEKEEKEKAEGRR